MITHEEHLADNLMYHMECEICCKELNSQMKRNKFERDMNLVKEGLNNPDVQILLKGVKMTEGSERESTLLEADKIVNGARQKDYGTPWVNHTITAKYWEILFGVKITAEQVCKANILQKLARSHNAYKRDNYVDIAGYAENADLCSIEEERMKNLI